MALAGGLQHGPYEEILWLPVAKTDFVPLYKKEIWDVFLDGILSHSQPSSFRILSLLPEGRRIVIPWTGS